jgi:hypothetical protein
VVNVNLQEREVWNAKRRKHGHEHPTDSFAIARKSRHKGSRVTILETKSRPMHGLDATPLRSLGVGLRPLGSQVHVETGAKPMGDHMEL